MMHMNGDDLEVTNYAMIQITGSTGGVKFSRCFDGSILYPNETLICKCPAL